MHFAKCGVKTAAVAVQPLTEQLAGASDDAQAVVRALSMRDRVDLATLPRGCLALLLAQASREHSRRFLVVTPDADSAAKLEADLRCFVGADDARDERGGVLYYPSADTTPFVDVAPDQRAAMDRLSVLFHLCAADCRGACWSCPRPRSCAACLRATQYSAAARASPSPTSWRAKRCFRCWSRAATCASRWSRTPGTFAVRGGILDVFPPHAEHPSRIELDDELVASIKRFDPDDQRTLDAQEAVAHPSGARHAARTRRARARARTRQRPVRLAEPADVAPAPAGRRHRQRPALPRRRELPAGVLSGSSRRCSTTCRATCGTW